MEGALLILSFVFLSLAASAGDFIKMKNETLTVTATPFKSSNAGMTKIQERFVPTLDRVYYIVQFDGPVLQDWKNELVKAGIKIGSYLPDDGFLMKIQNLNGWNALNKSPHVKGVVDFKTDLRISKEFESVSFQDRSKASQAVFRLTFKNEIPNFISVAKQRNIPFVIEAITGELIQVQALKNNIEKLADIEGVEWVEPFKMMSTFDFDISSAGTALTPEGASDVLGAGDYSDLTGYESGTKLMNFEPAYAQNLHGEGEIVGIADTGLDRGSMTDLLEDLKGQILKGYALGFFSKTWADPQGHGTHTSGSIVGDGASSKGLLRGGAFKAQLIMQSLWSPMLKNLSIIPDFDKIFGVMRRNDNVHIHSNSWGSPASLGVYDNFAQMVDEVSWNHPDLLIVFAAGNSGVDKNKDGHIDEGSVSSPGTAKNCLTVGASKNLVLQGGIQKMMKDLKGGDENWGAEPIASSRLSETPNGMAAFSSIGPTQDGRLKPEIVAPGTNIISTRSQAEGASPLWGAYNDIYAYAGGTSMATPLTSGAAALVRQNLVRIGFANPSAALVKATMIHGSTDLFPGQFGTGPGQEFKTPRPNVNEGYGRVDVGASVSLTHEKLFDETSGLKTGETKTYTLNVKQGEVVRVTMSYTDAPASAGAAQALVNDLDLKVVDGQGRSYFPNHLGKPDVTNNTEMVEFVSEGGGSYSVTVYGRNVPKGHETTGTQPFALVLQ